MSMDSHTESHQDVNIAPDVSIVKPAPFTVPEDFFFLVQIDEWFLKVTWKCK